MLRKRVSRLFRWLGLGLGYVALGLIALVALVMVAINVPLISNIVVRKVTSALEPTFKGQLVIERIGHVDFGGVLGAEVEIIDPNGQTVIEARNVDVRVFWPKLVWGILTVSSEADMSLDIDRVDVEHVEVSLIDDGSGVPSLAHAFEPREPEPVETEPATAGGTIVFLREIRVGTALVRGALPGPGPIDADVSRLEASLELRPETLHIALQRLDISARQLPSIETLSGQLTGDMTLPLGEEADTNPERAPVAGRDDATTTTYALRPPARRISASFAGELAGSGATAQFRMVGDELRAVLTAPEVTPATLTRVVPGLSPRASTGLEAKVEGALDDFGFEARVTQDSALAKARGRVRQDAEAETSQIEAHVDVAHADLARLVSGSPSTELSLGADAELSFGSTGGKGHYRVVTRASRVAAERLPETRIQGDLALPSDRPVVTRGTLEIDEPGAPTELTYRVEAGDVGTRVEVSSRTELQRPPRLAALAGGLAVVGELGAQARFDTESEQLDACFNLDLSTVEHGDVRARWLKVKGVVAGDAARPKLDVSAKLDRVRAAGRTFSDVIASARGTLQRLQVSATSTSRNPDRIELEGVLSTGRELAVSEPELRVLSRRGHVRAHARRVAFPPGKIHVDGLVLDGPGHAELSLRYGPRLEQLQLRTKDLNVASLLDIAGVRSPLRDARLNIEAELTGRDPLPSGKLELALTNLVIDKLKDGQARANLVLDRGKITGKAEVELAHGAKTLLSVKDLKVPLGYAGISELRSGMRSSSGDVALSGELDLNQLEGFLTSIGLERAEGKVRFDVALERAKTDGARAWRAHLETKKLVLVEARPDVSQSPSPGQAQRSAPLWLRGIDLNLDAALEGDRVNVQGKLFDRQGDVLRVKAEWKELAGLSSPARLRESFLRAPFTARAEVPRRDFAQFPAPVRLMEIEGIFSLGVEAEGSLLDPKVRTRARIERYAPASDRRRQRVLDLELGADYARKGGSVRLRAHDGKQPLLDLASDWTGDAAELAEKLDGESPVSGDVRLDLHEFPVEMVPALSNRRMRGKVSGTARLDQLGRDATFVMDLTAQVLRVERLRIDQVKANLRAENGQLVASASIAGNAGRADAAVETGFAWGNRVVPTLDDQLKGTLRTQNLRLAAFAPLFEGSVSELDGRLDAELRAVIEGGAPRLSGQASLTEGVVHIPDVGQRLHDISASLMVTPDAIVLERLRARGTSGGFEADAEAKLEGLTPTSASMNVRIKERDKLPLTVEGEAVGDGWGNISARYQHDEANKKNTLNVNLEKFNIELPQAPPRGIQDLNQPEHVRVGFHRKDGKFVDIPLQPLEEPGAPSEYETLIVVELGSVSVKKGQQAEVALGGEVRATLGEELDVRGRVDTRRGELDISGKTFEIERGSVTFTGGKPDDPTISAVARYDSPDGYTVYAEYTGTATNGKLRLSSEPPLGQDEILTLLLFGSPDGSFGASGTDSVGTAVSVMGGAATQGFNRALSDVTDLDVAARIDTSTGAPRPELVLQLSSRVAARVTQSLGEPAPGQSPDRTFLTIELRLASAWSLSTMIGDRGASALDLIWRRRY